MVDVRVATDEDVSRWNGYVSRSPHGTLFHEYDALRTLAEYAGARLHPLVGFKGQEPVGVFPVFAIRKGPVMTAFSPPPDLRVPALGPATLNLGKLKQRKREKRRERFVDGCLEWIDDELGPRYTHVRTGPAYSDVRSFKWAAYDVTPEFTYHVDLSADEDDLLSRFSSDARRNVTNTPADAYEIVDGASDRLVSGSDGVDDGTDGAPALSAADTDGATAIRRIVAQVRERYHSQGVDFDVPADFVVDLHERADRGAVRPYVCRVDGGFVGGILAVEYGDTIGRWMGGVRTDRDVDVPVNDLLDWAVMRDARDRGLATYDLVGGETRRINRYKAKFDPSLRTAYSMERGSWGMQTLAHLYQSVTK
ncbi:GNAT family N-acetyltransferase [Halovivax cerinus]|uniref:GNAT family N-acetyltransferase n=1 Tax=Halovivax cerinus TaxID=1487865 RepID=A0ABD5NU58_9EURY|nr:GNAT family N-acetyltransferase [Halovivax cerinus]